MKYLFEAADRYMKKCTWKDMAVIKFCLVSIGIMAGSYLTDKSRKPVRTAALIVFLSTYIPLMAKFITVLLTKEDA